MANPFVGEDNTIKVITGIPNSITHESKDGGSNGNIQGVITRLELIESSNLALQTKVGELASRVATIESENISLKKQLNENKKQDTLHHPPSDTLHAEILHLKNKQEEIRSQ
jgi:dimeric dUTPase (all-alpha-NTP-PPase superfamily)